MEENYIDQFRKSLDRFTPVREESFSKLRSLVKFKAVKKGAFLLHAGETAQKLHFVCEGILVSQFMTQDGSAHIKNFFLEGNFAASKVSLLLACPSSFSIQCLEDAVVIDIDFKKYKQLINEDNHLKHFYISYLEQNWIIENEKRQIAFATQTSTERYLTFLEEYPFLDKRVPQHHIASYLGITPTQLSRIRKDLNKNQAPQQM